MEINVEAPKEISEEIAKVLYDCMIKAGAVFCTRCKLDADISRLDKCIKDFYYNNELLAKKGDIIKVGEESFKNFTTNKTYNYSIMFDKEYFSNDGPLPNFWIH